MIGKRSTTKERTTLWPLSVTVSSRWPRHGRSESSFCCLCRLLRESVSSQRVSRSHWYSMASHISIRSRARQSPSKETWSFWTVVYISRLSLIRTNWPAWTCLTVIHWESCTALEIRSKAWTCLAVILWNGWTALRICSRAWTCLAVILWKVWTAVRIYFKAWTLRTTKHLLIYLVIIIS